MKKKASKLPAVRGKQVALRKAPKAKIPQAKAPKGIQLKLKRSQRKSALGQVIFILDARIEMSPQQLEEVRHYKLGNRVVYESSTRKKYQDNAAAHIDNSYNNTKFFAPAGEQLRGIGKTFYRLARAGVSAAIAGLSLKVTVNSLLKGVHVECKSMGELMEAEEAIREAAQNVKGYLMTAATYNKHHEELVEL